MKNYIFFFFTIASSLNIVICSAQNLIPNGSFEQLTSCPQSYSGIDSCVGWFTEANTPDCLATCAPYPVSVPENYFGYQSPFEGSNYAGIYTFAVTSFDYRETFGIKLTDSLIVGTTYHFSMRVSRGYKVPYIIGACNHLGAKLSKYKFVANNPFSLDNYQQLHEDSIIADSVNWVLLHWNFIADSNYKYVYVGNFYDDLHTDTLNASKPNSEVYYYVDSVNLYCLNCDEGISKQVSSQSSILYDENSRNLSFRLNGIGSSEFLLLNMIGQQIFQADVNDKTVISLYTLTAGVYIAVLKTKNGEIVKKILIQ